jgi:hypothetical protein
MNPHKLYISSIAVICVLILILGSAWREHVRDDARRDAILGTQKSDIDTLQQNIAAAEGTQTMAECVPVPRPDSSTKICARKPVESE